MSSFSPIYSKLDYKNRAKIVIFKGLIYNGVKTKKLNIKQIKTSKCNQHRDNTKRIKCREKKERLVDFVKLHKSKNNVKIKIRTHLK